MLIADYLNYPPIDTGVFSDSYTRARQLFLASVARHSGHSLEQVYLCSGETPEGEKLSTDTLWLGSADAENVVVLLAGTHGVEGFVGSAVLLDQLKLIALSELQLPGHTAILLVHALTPWGYAWLRRCDEDGVDLNRNAVDFALPLPENAGYQSLRAVIASGDKEQIQAAFAEFERQHGRSALEVAISGGQFTDPAGPFYGGTKPAHGRLVTEDLIRKYALNERNLAVIDIHSGIGAYGYGEIICDHDPASAGTRIAQTWFGDSVALPALGTSISVPKLGLMDYLWHGSMNANSCFVTLEFGTYSTNRLFNVLLQDHHLWAQAANTMARQQHGLLMRRHFYPLEQAWQALVLFRARQVIAQALNGLNKL